MIYWKARAGIREVHFLPFNPTDKRTALTYLDGAGKMHRVSKGAPEQVWEILCVCLKLMSCASVLHIDTMREMEWGPPYNQSDWTIDICHGFRGVYTDPHGLDH